ncbi:MAG: hypothetical protein AB7K37_16210 [Cyclobacteriaceae bacterium]
MEKLIVVTTVLLMAPGVYAQEQQTNDFLRDRGDGIPTSLFGTYIEKGDFIFYPFYEYYVERQSEYNPLDLGFNTNQAFRGKFSAREELVYVAYGLNDWLMFELEASVIQARQTKDSGDNSNMPAVYKESGIENIEGQVRWRYWKETARKPELYSYFLTVLPTQGSNSLIGTPGYEFKLGTGLYKGFHFGTLSINTAIQYDTDAKEYAFGGFTIEYLKRINKTFRVYTAFEGIPEETEWITELQIFPAPWLFFRLNNAIGISPDATDIAPEVGLLMYLNKIRRR